MKRKSRFLLSFVALLAVISPAVSFAQYFAPLPNDQRQQVDSSVNYRLAAREQNGVAAGADVAQGVSGGSPYYVSMVPRSDGGGAEVAGAEAPILAGSGDAWGTPTMAPCGASAGCGASNGCTSTYGNATYGSGGPSCGNGYTGSLFRNRPRGVWYASAAGLYLQRSNPPRVWTTYENNNNSNQLMSTQQVDTNGRGGADLRLGRYFACNRWALELGYWSVSNFNDYATQTHANGVSSPLQFNDLEFAPSDAVVDYFDSASAHRLTRSNELHNIEVNAIAGIPSCQGCGRWSYQMLVGVRYFKFDEDLLFETLDQGGTWGGNGGLDEVRLSDSVSNDLIGAQVGCFMKRPIGSRANFFITPKFGIYNNHIENRFDLRRGDGTAAAPSAFSGVSGSYPVESSTDVVSFLSEVNLGMQYQMTNRWTLYGGYRVVAITGVGLADNQIPQFIVDIPEIADIDTDGSLVLHGAFFGVSYSL